MKTITLVIMAAGIGSRFGGGIKQLEPVGPNGEIIMDYSILDAMKAGFNKVVFVIRKDLEKDFKKVIGNRIEKKVETAYVFQEVENISNKYRMKFETRTKPWGTGQAILCCKDVVKEPFLIINADDYYGKEAYLKAYAYLAEMKPEDKGACMVGFKLENTLSENGGVTRGVCTVGKERKLISIEETYNIRKVNCEAVADSLGGEKSLSLDTEVSMNMWGLKPAFFTKLEACFEQFLESIEAGEKKKEFLLPDVIGRLLKNQEIEIEVLQSKDKWFGVTYKEDKDKVLSAVAELVCEGEYEVGINS